MFEVSLKNLRNYRKILIWKTKRIIYLIIGKRQLLEAENESLLLKKIPKIIIIKLKKKNTNNILT